MCRNSRCHGHQIPRKLTPDSSLIPNHLIVPRGQRRQLRATKGGGSACGQNGARSGSTHQGEEPTVSEKGREREGGETFSPRAFGEQSFVDFFAVHAAVSAAPSLP